MMVYTYINSITQLGLTQNTLLVADDTGAFAPQRIDKLFDGVPNEEELQAAAQEDYDRLIAAAGVVDGG